jgi:hypothetical protein
MISISGPQLSQGKNEQGQWAMQPYWQNFYNSLAERSSPEMSANICYQTAFRLGLEDRNPCVAWARLIHFILTRPLSLIFILLCSPIYIQVFIVCLCNICCGWLFFTRFTANPCFFLSVEMMTSYSDHGFHLKVGSRGSVVVKALCYKPEGLRFDSLWGDF